MMTVELLSSVLATLDEKIPTCSQLVSEGACSWDCCTYTDSYILLLPGEKESAERMGFSLSHYNIIDDNYHGGMKIVPADMGCCVSPGQGSNAYKPVDCRVFPFWFQFAGDELEIVEGKSCPAIRMGLYLNKYRDQALRTGTLLARDGDIAEFLRKARMVNYSGDGSGIPVVSV
ncbi:hypothetical protein [Photorhabdus luminescens]|uniref:hypothetical protein n=1 Tax=Photorhabdus luminescens TaxID=29488 RepID=UPI00223F510E|nr:hypothetical protein [Photorhabdus luminescens]MCW7761980.1 hypothetical protein [Photorhabdus luminescens subsp. venezuelensis]